VYKFVDVPLLWVIVGGLAAWRLTSIIHHEKVAAPFRKLLGVKELTETDWAYPDTFIGELIECFWCTSVWVSIIVSIIVFFFPPILLPFAFSTVAIMIEKQQRQD
jgi:uncharacterized protein DUF1360